MLFFVSESFSLFSTMNCEGWKLNRTSASRASRPKRARSLADSFTILWNCGMSGCVAYGAMSDDMRYM